MLGFTSDQRRMLIDKLPDAANMAWGALLFGQFLGERPFSLTMAVFGTVVWLAFVGGSLWLGGRRRNPWT